MTWKDVLYPSNSKMKKRLAELCGHLDTHLEYCFTAVNNLIDCIEKYLPGQQFEKIAVQTSQCLRYNCNLIITRVNEINEYLEMKVNYLERLIGTDLFQQIMSLDTPFQKYIDILQNVLMAVETAAITIGGAVLLKMINTGVIFAGLVTTLGPIGACMIASIGITVFGFAVDIIISAILGAVEEAKLENALEEYEEAVETFKPAAIKFYEDISMMRARIEVMNNE